MPEGLSWGRRSRRQNIADATKPVVAVKHLDDCSTVIPSSGLTSLAMSRYTHYRGDYCVPADSTLVDVYPQHAMNCRLVADGSWADGKVRSPYYLITYCHNAAVEYGITERTMVWP